MPRWSVVGLVIVLVLAAPHMLRAGPLDGQWQGQAPQVRGRSCFLGFTLSVAGNKLSGFAQTEKGEAKIDGTVRPDGSFTYSGKFVAGGAATSGSGKFAGNKFEATQHTPCGDLTATGGHIGY